MTKERPAKMLTGIAATALGLMMALGACGETAPNPPGDEPAQTAEPEPDAPQTADQGTENSEATQTPAPADNSPEKRLEGKWVLVYSMFHSSSDDGYEYEYCTMTADEDAPDSTISVSFKDGKPVANYKYLNYETSFRAYGCELDYHAGTAYEGCPNTEWYYTFKSPEDEEEFSTSRITLTEDDRMIISEEYSEPGGEDYSGYRSLEENFYLRDDSPLLEDLDSLRYFDTVTVDNATDLLNSIASNRKVLLKPGTYNLSSVPASRINNKKVTENYGQLTFNEVNHFCIEPESEGDILICVSDAYSPVMEFNEGSHITIRGITAGHAVEPGYCSGSVLSFNTVGSLTIDKCNLYGCGTYGIEAYSTYNATVTDTEIYECTYGLVSLSQSGSFNFKNCVMRDSKDLDMISLNSIYDVTFEDCEFRGNSAMSYDTCSFVSLGEYDSATFRNCKFIDNEYYTFSNREVVMENCTSDNNRAGFNELMSRPEPITREELLTMYEETRTKQEEIDNKLSSDSFMDQQTLNQTAQEQFEMWDILLNKIWAYLKDNLGEEEMTALSDEENKWIKDKEAQVKAATADFEGGSMKPMIEYSTGADITEKRVIYLVENYLRSLEQ
ncbi:MAG: right-handed parallel beta-helix repeat-containing protein [Lachnospiraceae bacterium]|nr:right-handed parallel beta-helix repeat-containing protein [Lachnospiraceae bacterium]